MALLTPNALGVIFCCVYVWHRPLRNVCPECGTLARPGAQFGARCGHRLQQPACTGCGQTVAVGDAFCVSCGRALEI